MCSRTGIHAEVNGSRLPMSNDLITEKLGKFGIQGAEDLIHEIYSVPGWILQDCRTCMPLECWRMFSCIQSMMRRKGKNKRQEPFEDARARTRGKLRCCMRQDQA